MASVSPRLSSNSIVSVKSPVFDDFDSVFDVTGGFGRYHIFLGFFAQWSSLLMAGNIYMMSFGALEPTWRCDAFTDQPIDHCQFMYNCTDANGTSLLRVESIFYSVIEQWELTCEYDYIPYLMISIQMIGQAIGAVIGSHLADHLGRKWISLIGLMGMIASGMLSALSPTWHVLTALLFIMGLSLAMFYAAIVVLAMELTGKRYRIITNCCFTWVVGFLVAALVAYLSRDWRVYAVTMNALCIPMLILLFFLYESPRWLIQKKKFEEACKILNKMARWNKKKVTVTVESLKTIQLDTSNSSSYSVLSLFGTKRLALYTIICLISAYISASITGIILFNIGNLAGDPFLSIALYGIIRVWTPPFMILMELKNAYFGRRTMYLGSLAFVLVCFIGIIAIYSTGTTDFTWLCVATAFALSGSAITASIFDSAIILYVTELFPTVIRAIAFGTINLADHIGSIIAPQLLALQKYWTQLPFVVLASVSLVALVMGFLVLPETGGKSLPDKFTDVGKETPEKKKDVQNGNGYGTTGTEMTVAVVG